MELSLSQPSTDQGCVSYQYLCIISCLTGTVFKCPIKIVQPYIILWASLSMRGISLSFLKLCVSSAEFFKDWCQILTENLTWILYAALMYSILTTFLALFNTVNNCIPEGIHWNKPLELGRCLQHCFFWLPRRCCLFDCFFKYASQCYGSRLFVLDFLGDSHLGLKQSSCDD